MILQQPISLTSPAISVAFLLFTAGIFLSINAVNLTIGPVPVRALCMIASLTLIIGAFPLHLRHIMLAQQKLTSIIAISTLIGLAVSILNQAAMVLTLVQLIEIHFQAIVSLVLATFFVQILGVQRMAIIFLSIWLGTAISAIGQAMGLELAWQLRSVIGDWMNDPAITRAFYDQQKRVVGLSFTPVHLATQTCLAFAAFFAFRFSATSGKVMTNIDLPLVAGWLFAILICFISGNRSPLIGLLGFLAIYFWFASPRSRVLLIPLLLMAFLMLPMMQEFGQKFGLRIASSEDGSAIGRSTLWSFGLFLFTEHPLGYGVLFDSTEHAPDFVHQAIHLDNPDIIKHFSLHNYYLLMANKYGFLIFFLIPWILPRNKIQLMGWLAFIPYILHIAFHNEGPLSSDFLIWLLIPLFSGLHGQFHAGQRPEQNLFPRDATNVNQ